MIGIEYILLVNMIIFSIVLIVLLIISGIKSNRPKKKNSMISSDMAKIKEQISEDLD